MTLKEQLKLLSMNELRKKAADMGIVLAIRDRTRSQIADKIIKRSIEKQTAEAMSKDIPNTPVRAVSSKPAFENLCKKDDIIDDQASEQDEAIPPIVENRGGVRPGAGRPIGATEINVLANRALQNETPDPTIKFLVQSFFSGWAKFSGIKEIEINDDEAKLLSLPVTNYMILKNKSVGLPPEAMIAIAGIIAIQQVFLPRLGMFLKKVKDKKDANRADSKISIGQTGQRENSQGDQVTGKQ